MPASVVRDSTPVPAATREVLVFVLGARRYAFDVDAVVEVVRMVTLTHVPESPSWVLGLLNLRGRVIPVIDVAARLEVGRCPAGLDTPIVVVRGDAGTVGVLVDAIVDLVQTAVEPAAGVALTGANVSAVVRDQEGLVIVLNPAGLQHGAEAAGQRRQ